MLRAVFMLEHAEGYFLNEDDTRQCDLAELCCVLGLGVKDADIGQRLCGQCSSEQTNGWACLYL